MKPVFHDVAELIGGLIEADEKKKKRTYTASKYAKFDIEPLPATPPARLAPRARRLGAPVDAAPARAPRARRPAAEPAVDAPARRGRPPGKPKAKRRTKLEMVQARAEEQERARVQALEEAREKEGTAYKVLTRYQKRVAAKRSPAKDVRPEAEEKTEELPAPSPKKARAASKIKPLVAEFSALTEPVLGPPQIGLGRFLGRLCR